MHPYGACYNMSLGPIVLATTVQCQQKCQAHCGDCCIVSFQRVPAWSSDDRMWIHRQEPQQYAGAGRHHTVAALERCPGCGNEPLCQPPGYIHVDVHWLHLARNLFVDERYLDHARCVPEARRVKIGKRSTQSEFSKVQVAHAIAGLPPHK